MNKVRVHVNARILKVYNLSLTNFVNISRRYLKSVDVQLPAPSEIKSVSRLIIIIKSVMHGHNCLRTNAKRLSSSLLCEERASGNKSYLIEIRRQAVKKWVKNKVNFVGDDLGNVIA